MKLLKNTLIALAVASSFSSFAASVAITNTTVYTGTDQGVLTNAVVVFEDGKISAINPAQVNADETIDGSDQVVTPGFIAALSNIGLVEVGAVSTSRDARPKKSSISFDPSLAFNPESSLIPFARKGGITRSIVAPVAHDDIFAGQAFTVLLNSEFESVVDTGVAIVANFGASGSDSRASSLLTLIEKLEKQQTELNKDSADDDKKKEPGKEQKLLTSLLKGEKPLVAKAARASDLLQLIKIKETFGINLVIAGAQDAVQVKQQLAAANVPVIINVVDNLPGNFDSLHVSLNAAGELEQAGVKVLLTVYDSHLIYNLRTDAGNAVANGMSKTGAINALTKNIAEVFNMNTGIIAVGKPADLVLWNGDPLEISSKVNKIWINGEAISTRSRQDDLRDRYTSKEQKPRAYIK